MCSYHELHVETQAAPDPESISSIILPSLPSGFDTQVSLVEVLDDINTVVYKIAYSSVTRSLSHEMAGELKCRVEKAAVLEGLSLRQVKLSGKPAIPMPLTVFNTT